MEMFNNLLWAGGPFKRDFGLSGELTENALDYLADLCKPGWYFWKEWASSLK